MEIQGKITEKDIFPPLPPDYIFKYRKNRISPSVDVAQKYVTYLYDRIEYKKGEGIFFYYKGIELPKAGFPFSQAVYSINPAKRLFARTLTLIASKDIFSPIKILEKLLIILCDIADMTMTPYYLERDYYCKTATEVRKFTEAFLLALGISQETSVRFSELMAMIFEFDDAYRYRWQDLMSETTKEKLLANLPKEIVRLLKIHDQRENTMKENALLANPYTVSIKFKSFGRIIRFMYWIPRVRIAIKAGLNAVNFENWQLSRADIYHNYLYSDYNIQGRILEERQKIYLSLYGDDISKAPPRYEVNVSQ